MSQSIPEILIHILPGLKTQGDYMNYLINYLTKGSLN